MTNVEKINDLFRKNQLKMAEMLTRSLYSYTVPASAANQYNIGQGSVTNSLPKAKPWSISEDFWARNHTKFIGFTVGLPWDDQIIGGVVKGRLYIIRYDFMNPDAKDQEVMCLDGQWRKWDDVDHG